MADTLIVDKVPNGHPNEDDVLLQDDVEKVIDPDDDDDDDDDDDKEDVEDSSDKDKDDEDKDDATDDEKVELLHDRPSIKDIKAKYPEFFKEFPQLREAYFREIEYTKIFPTVEEAQEAFTDNEAFTALSDSALSGDPSKLLESIEKTDVKAFKLFASSFLPELYKRNQEAYHEAVTPLWENLVRHLYKSTDENLKNTALNLANYIFGEDGENVASGKKTLSKVQELTEEQKRLRGEKDTQTAQKMRECHNRALTQIDLGLKTLILRDFDLEKTFSKFMRNQLADEVVKRVHKQLESDKSHMTVMGSRWRRAKANGYTSDDESKIVSTFLARAKSLIPGVSAKVRTLAGAKQSRASEEKIERLSPERKEVNGGRVASGSSPKKDYRKMTDMEILNS